MAIVPEAVLVIVVIADGLGVCIVVTLPVLKSSSQNDLRTFGTNFDRSFIFVTFSAMHPWYPSGRLFEWASIYSICMVIICRFL